MNITLTPCEGVALRCALCHGEDLDGLLLCPGCRTHVHAECRVGVACPTLGCGSRSRRTIARPVVVGPDPSWMSSLVLWVWGCLAFAGVLGGAWSCVTVAPIEQLKTARLHRAKADMRSIGNALDLFKIDCGRYPETFQSLWVRPADVSRWNGPYLKEYPPKDPWFNDYVYVRTGDTSYEISSHGADGARGCACAAADLSSRTIDDSW